MINTFFVPWFFQTWVLRSSYMDEHCRTGPLHQVGLNSGILTGPPRTTTSDSGPLLDFQSGSPLYDWSRVAHAQSDVSQLIQISRRVPAGFAFRGMGPVDPQDDRLVIKNSIYSMEYRIKESGIIVWLNRNLGVFISKEEVKKDFWDREVGMLYRWVKSLFLTVRKKT